MKLKLGQKIVFKKIHKIKLPNGKYIVVKKGDIAQVIKKVNSTTAEITYLTGEAKNYSENIKAEIDDTFNADLAAQKILNMINEQ
ncbi:hypothetical protein ACFIJ5_06050 [Haloimpatiens sp. FM7330]|uniref:hypothetical protein n=1 Tax=Haloimpatiens sp. FM7330 TaxID=3298610 RepID=UPI00362708BB